MSFSDDVRRFSAKAADAHDKITRLATLELFRGVILASVGAPAASPERLDPSGNSAVSEVIEKTPEGAGQVTYLSNDLPYIMALEEGSSKQAPEGMIRRNMDRVSRMVDAAIARSKV
jgi:hypothetical protein